VFSTFQTRYIYNTYNYDKQFTYIRTIYPIIDPLIHTDNGQFYIHD
jgi:hypothetical protein